MCGLMINIKTNFNTWYSFARDPRAGGPGFPDPRQRNLDPRQIKSKLITKCKKFIMNNFFDSW